MQKRIQKGIEKFNSTRLQMLEVSKYVAGNSSILMQNTARAVDVTTTTGAAYLGARNAAIDLAHGLEDYACSDYKCLALDTIAGTCDIVSSVAAFIPGGTKVFAISTASSGFCRTLRNKCKQMEGGLLGCK